MSRTNAEKAAQKRYQLVHPLVRYRARLQQRAKKYGCECLSTAEFRAWFNTQDIVCYYCGRNLTRGASLDALTID